MIKGLLLIALTLSTHCHFGQETSFKPKKEFKCVDLIGWDVEILDGSDLKRVIRALNYSKRDYYDCCYIESRFLLAVAYERLGKSRKAARIRKKAQRLKAKNMDTCADAAEGLLDYK